MEAFSQNWLILRLYRKCSSTELRAYSLHTVKIHDYFRDFYLILGVSDLRRAILTIREQEQS